MASIYIYRIFSIYIDYMSGLNDKTKDNITPAMASMFHATVMLLFLAMHNKITTNFTIAIVQKQLGLLVE